MLEIFLWQCVKLAISKFVPSSSNWSSSQSVKSMNSVNSNDHRGLSVLDRSTPDVSIFKRLESSAKMLSNLRIWESQIWNTLESLSELEVLKNRLSARLPNISRLISSSLWRMLMKIHYYWRIWWRIIKKQSIHLAANGWARTLAKSIDWWSVEELYLEVPEEVAKETVRNDLNRIWKVENSVKANSFA